MMKLLSLILLFFIGLSFFVFEKSTVENAANCACSRSGDSLILVDLYNATNGANWTTTWNLNDPIDIWEGINLNNQECVDVISLNNNGLTGSIPSSIGNLSALFDLRLSNNSIGGNIPDELSNLSNLKNLYLGGNNFVGSIPSSLGSLAQLVILSLSNNPTLTGGIPTELGMLSNLEQLGFNNCNLTGSIPNELGNLEKLTTLYLAINPLEGSIPSSLGDLDSLQLCWIFNTSISSFIPSALGNLSKLEDLRLNNNPNMMGAIPASLGNLDSLKSLLLNDCNLSDTIPSELGNLSKLENIRLSNNNLTGSIPSTFINLSQLREARLQNNQLSGDLPNIFGGLDSMRVFTAVNNQITGNIPNSVGNCTDLLIFTLSNNQISGAIPDSLGYTSLTILGLYNNQLTDSIPSSLGNLAELGQLELYNNQLIGNIPASFNNLINLESLLLHDNQLSGNIPTQLNNATKLRSINLRNNQLIGNIPANFGDLDSLTSLRLNLNQLTGIIPPELGNLSKLTTLVLNFNQLEGTIPVELGNLNQLTQLILSHNDLTGSIPASLGSLPLLFNLNLESNELTGTIPSSLGQLSNLATLNIRNNQLTGSLPTELGNLSNLEILYAELCELTGSIPSSLGNLSNLRDLWLQGNDLTGTIPNELGQLFNLEVLRLNANELEGEIPASFGNLSNLQGLYLDRQFLSGTIPSSLGNLSQLKTLNLEANELTGEIPAILGELNSIETLALSGNQFSGCIPVSFFNLCGKNVSLNNNPNLFAGDNFSLFCASGQGSCLDNYECADAIELPMNEDPCGRMFVAAKLDSATTSVPNPSLSCNTTFAGNDVWFKTTVPSTGNFLVRKDSISTIAPTIEAYAGNCGALTPIVCTELDSLPFVITIEDQNPGATIFFRVWEQNNTIVNAPEEAIIGLSAHLLAADTLEWELCDFPLAVLNDTLSQGAGNRTAAQFVLQFESNTSQSEVQNLTNDLSDDAVLIAECPCLNTPLQLWIADDPVAMETLRGKGKVSKSKSKVDTTNYNYLIEPRNILGNEATEGLQSNSTIGIDSSGNVFLVWQDYGKDGSLNGVFGRRFMPNAVPYGEDFLINSTITYDQESPNIAVNTVGQSVSVWMNGLTTKEIRGQVFDKNGNTLGREFRASGGNIGFNPKVALNNQNEFIVAWENIDTDGRGIAAQRMRGDGDPIGTVISVANETGNQLNPDVAMNDAGNFAIVWESNNEDIEYVLYGQNDTSEYIIRNAQNVGGASDEQELPTIDMNEIGGFVIVWKAIKTNGSTEIRARHFREDGGPNGASRRLFLNSMITSFDVAMLENGDFLLAFERFDGTDNNIYLQLFNSDRFPISNILLVNTETAGSQVQPTIAINNKNNAVVSWTSYGTDGLEQGVFAQRFTIDNNQGIITPTLDESTESGVGVVQSFSMTTYSPNNPSDSVKVALFDTGIDSDHPQLSNATWQNPEANDADNCLMGDIIGYDFVNEDGDPDDIDGHGSSVSGIVVNDFPDDVKLDIISMKFYENQRGTVFDAVCGIYYAVNEGAKIINLSWGFEASQFPEILYDALKYAAERDVLIITSAGNTSKNNDVIQKYPSNFDLDNMIVVTAFQTDPDGNNPRLADYASFGATTVDIAAAGFVETTNFDGTLVKQTGTSMAAPAVARTAAIIRAKYPCLTAQQIKNCIMSSVDTYDNFTGRTVSGGILNHQAALDCAALTSCLRLQVKVKLQGNYNSSEDLMNQDWTALNLVPTQSSYFASDSTTASVLQAKTAIPAGDEIVDWVKVQLRDKNDSSIVIAECSALLQRDGDVVDLDGESAVRFYNLSADEYFVAVIHQNHLSVMTSQAIMLIE